MNSMRQISVEKVTLNIGAGKDQAKLEKGIKLINHKPRLGKTQRNFAVTPNGRFLLAANQDSGNIVTFVINRESGRLEYTGHQVYIPAPVCIRILA